MRRLVGLGFAAWLLAGVLFVGSASAAPIAYGTYTLNNQIDPIGISEPPYWGLRLDEYVNVTGGSDVFSWDFNDPMSDMKLTYAPGSIHIYGESWGGLDTGTAYTSYTGLYTIDFWYVEGVTSSPDGGPFDDVRVTPGGAPNLNLGSISGPGGSYGLTDYTTGGVSFNFGDTPNGIYRGYVGLSGWGRLAYCDFNVTSPETCPHVKASGWQFIATPYSPVPEPSSVLLMGVGLLGGWILMTRRARRHGITA